MASFKQGSVVFTEKATPVAPSNPGEISVVARGGELYKFDGVTETILGGVTGLGSAAYEDVATDIPVTSLDIVSYTAPYTTITNSGNYSVDNLITNGVLDIDDTASANANEIYYIKNNSGAATPTLIYYRGVSYPSNIPDGEIWKVTTDPMMGSVMEFVQVSKFNFGTATGTQLPKRNDPVFTKVDNLETYVSGELSDYVTLNTDQTISNCTKTFASEGGLVAINPIIKSANYDIKYMRLQDDIMSAPLSGSLNASAALGGKTIGYFTEDESLSGGFRIHGMSNGSGAGLVLNGYTINSPEGGNYKAPLELRSARINTAVDTAWADSDTIVRIRNLETPVISIMGDGTIVNNALGAMARTSAGQSIPSGTYTKVVFGTVDYDPSASIVNPGGGDWYYQAKHTGWYQYNCKVMFGATNWINSGTGEYRTFALRHIRNSEVELTRTIHDFFITTATTIYKHLGGSNLVYLNKNDKLYIYVFHDKSTAVSLLNEAPLNYFTISYQGNIKGS